MEEYSIRASALSNHPRSCTSSASILEERQMSIRAKRSQRTPHGFSRAEQTIWSAYRDESWTGLTPGTATLQRRMLHMFRKLNLNPGEVPASNLVFVRSERKAKLSGEFSQLAKECWTFHEAVVNKLRVRVILCLGRNLEIGSARGWVLDPKWMSS